MRPWRLSHECDPPAAERPGGASWWSALTPLAQPTATSTLPLPSPPKTNDANEIDSDYATPCSAM